MNISTQELITFAALLGASVVIMIGLGVRSIVAAFRHDGKDRLELIAVGLLEIILFGGFFLLQLVRISTNF